MTQVKIFFNKPEEYRRVIVKSFSDLKEKSKEYILTHYTKAEVDIKYQYEDVDGDLVQFSSEQEWELAKTHSKKKSEMEIQVVFTKSRITKEKCVDELQENLTKLKKHIYKMFPCFESPLTLKSSKIIMTCLVLCCVCLSICIMVLMFGYYCRNLIQDFGISRMNREYIDQSTKILGRLEQWQEKSLNSGKITNKLMNGYSLGAGEMLHSGNYYLIVQEDCNVVIYKNKPFNKEYAIWSTRTDINDSWRPYGKCRLKMDLTNNLILYDHDFIKILWTSDTRGLGKEGKGYCELREDGSLAIVTHSVTIQQA
jgi:hypothetical protein